MTKNKVQHDDALRFFAGLPDQSCDLVFADPPYFLGVDKEFGVRLPFRTLDEYVEWCGKWFAESKRILKPDGNIAIHAIHHYAAHLHVKLIETGFAYRRQLIWHYENGFSKPRNGPATHYEPVLWFGLHDDSYYKVQRIPYKSQARLKHKIWKNGKQWHPHPDGKQMGDVLSVPTLAGRRFRDEKVEHPTQKPLALSRLIIEMLAPDSGTVCVPFAGSGTECVAAIESGREFYAAELNSTFVAIAESRLAATEDRADASELGSVLGKHRDTLADNPVG